MNAAAIRNAYVAQLLAALDTLCLDVNAVMLGRAMVETATMVELDAAHAHAQRVAVSDAAEGDWFDAEVAREMCERIIIGVLESDRPALEADTVRAQLARIVTL